MACCYPYYVLCLTPNETYLVSPSFRLLNSPLPVHWGRNVTAGVSGRASRRPTALARGVSLIVC